MKRILFILAFPLTCFALAPGQPTPTQVAVYHREHGITNAAYALGLDGKWSGQVPKLADCREPANADYVQRTWLASRTNTVATTNLNLKTR